MRDPSQQHDPPPGMTVELARLEADAAASELEERRPDPEDGLPGLEPDRTVTDWGRSERVTGLADATLFGFLYHYWFRVEVEGIENVPASGGALLVANRSGHLPVDAAMVVKALRDEHPQHRHLHPALQRTFGELPGLGMALTKLGAVNAHPANLHRLLFDERQLVLLFPEGERAPHKPLRSRYRLRRFDAMDFVAAAMRARAPIVPVAVLGAEEATPVLGAPAVLGRRLRLPIAPPVPLPAKFRLRFLQPVRTDDVEPGAWQDRGHAAEVGEEIRMLLQENLFDMVAGRRSVWLG